MLRLLGNTCRAVFQEIAGEDTGDALVAFDDAALCQFANTGQGGGGSWLAANACAINHSFGGENFFVADFFDDAVGLLDHMARAGETDGVANLDSGRNGMRQYG